MLWIAVVLLLFIIQIATVLVGHFKHPSKTVAWLVILFIVPFVGFIIYYFLAKEYTKKHSTKNKLGKEDRRSLPRQSSSGKHRLNQTMLAASKPNAIDDAGNPTALDTRSKQKNLEIYGNTRLRAICEHIPESSISGNNQVNVLTNADVTYKAMLEAISKARRHIHFEFYTIRSDDIGGVFREILIRKAREGVKVRVIYDGVGSYKLSGDYLRELKAAGVEAYSFFSPLFAFFNKRMNYRNHRKIIIVDGQAGFLGGINIGDEYLGANPKLGFWRDTHLKLQGDAVYFLQQTFMTDWSHCSGQQLTGPDLFPEQNQQHSELVQMVASGPDDHTDSILQLFFAGITAAKERIYLTTPYFIPDPSLIMGLKLAALSGVDVKIIIPDVPDSKVVQYASKSYLHELLQVGVRFFLYKKGFMHAKVMLIDQLIATVGSTNLDMRSFFSNFELNAVMYNREAIIRLEKDFIEDLKESVELKLAEFEQRSSWEKRKEMLARLLSPLL
ncbi:cardiolipin synthase [Paenibacillus eucommiae]|uniref:Cardiolipin synthase n=1 Tax=Paenibacillus eucommiae TaxID=1355755 RepID=A0ABS4J7C8_9BACL|nr:cardiolipin synthase [Paenibacillus eucommiae]MBP1995006.1 cardiolipin synthase [Paenibacillus eucommiae]